MPPDACLDLRGTVPLGEIRFDAIVLAGGEGERLGGVDKAMLRRGRTTLLDTVLVAAGAADRIICVGPERPTAASVIWCREEPAGGGPVAAIQAGIAQATAGTVCVLACDLPLIDGPTVRRLVAGTKGKDGCVALDPSGRVQYLAAAYNRARLQRALQGAAVGGMSMRELTSGFSLVTLRADTVVDVDTDDDVAAFDLAPASRDASGVSRSSEPHHGERT